jgi:hypothetical protein
MKYLTAAVFLALTLIAAPAAYIATVSAPCHTEDATLCTWHADEHGNGTGQSFTDTGLFVIYHP